MRKFWNGVIGAGMLCAAPAWAQDGLAGTWEGELNVDSSTTVIVQFIIKEDESGSYSALLNAPDEPNLQDIPVTAFDYDRGKLRMDVAKVSGVYEGTVEADAIRGTWSQQGAAFPLDLEPFTEPVLSQEQKDRLRGTWYGTLDSPGMPEGLTIGFRFETNEEQEFAAFLDSPDQGVSSIAVDQFTLQDDQIRIRMLNPTKIEFTATLSGDRMIGEFTQRGTMPLTLAKGEYRLVGLDLAPEAKERLAGAWHGQVRNTNTVVLRFWNAEDGRFLGVFDSPDQGRYGMRVSGVEVQGDQLSLNVPGVAATLEAELSADEIVGEYEQNSRSLAMNLSRGEYLAHEMQLPDPVVAQLLGKWEAKTANTTFVFRFEEGDNGKSLAFLDIPNERLRGLPITDMNVEGEELTLIVRGIGAEFEGAWTAREISGEWTMPDVQFPIVISKVGN